MGVKSLVSVALLVSAVIHLLPLLGVLGSEQLTSLYGLPFDEPNLAILMRHRAVLLGLLGAFLLVAAFRPAHQPLALVAGFASVLPFLALVATTRGVNVQVARVFTADIVALLSLVVGSIAYFVATKRR